MSHTSTPSLDQVSEQAQSLEGPTWVPVFRTLFADSLTPVLAYRRLVRGDDRMAPSFLFESVVDGNAAARYSFLGVRPRAEFLVYGHAVELTDHGSRQTISWTSQNPLDDLEQQASGIGYAANSALPAFTGGWVGFVGYDTVRYGEPEKLNNPPHDDRGLPDIHLQQVLDLVAFDQARKTILVISHALIGGEQPPEEAYAEAEARLDELTQRLAHRPSSLADSQDELINTPLDLKASPKPLPVSNMGEGGYQKAVEVCKQYIGAGDAFQIVPSQRFERKTKADPFDVYRALRVVNPSPYMFYLQAKDAILVGSSPEILCKVQDGIATTRPLAGTRKRGATVAEDQALEEELVADPKDRAEHIMLVDLHRNDLGRVCQPGTIKLSKLLNVERYSHVMHISSTVTGEVRDDSNRWDALRVSLPVGTVSGAPKIRAMQIIDELEPTRRGPYAGAVGYADLAGNMDMAIALRTMVITPDQEAETSGGASGGGGAASGGWTVHIQAGAGIVADSDPDAEHIETVNKAAAMAKSIDLAEQVLTND